MRRSKSRLLFAAIGVSFCFIVLLFVLTHSNGNIHLGGPEPNKCDCPSVKDAPKVEIVPTVSTSTSTQSTTLISTTTITTVKPQICNEIPKSSPIQRAILIYYPHHQKEYFFPEVRWLYRSWVEMLLYQPSNWRTDIVVYTYNFTNEFRQLGCVNRIRQNKEEPSMCRLFLYVPVHLRTKNLTRNNFQHVFDSAKHVMASYKDMNDPFIGVPSVNDTETFDAKRSEDLYQYLRTYGYVDSINTVYEGYWTFKMYDFVLRTDIDVFIYRHFGNYTPSNCTFITGRGGYGTDFNRRKLSRIARDMGLEHANVSGMGSTWYGSAYDAYLVANYTLNGMLWLVRYEFSGPEREGRLGTSLWPEWHFGVLLLYGQHLGLNHLLGANRLQLFIGTELLDQSTTQKSPDYVKQGIRLNLHCWHTSERFSKFAFKMGRYNQSELALYKNDTTAQAYAMRMALESKSMTLEELAAYGRNKSLSH